MREVLPGVFTWPWRSERHGYDFHGTLVLHREGNLCIDPAECGEDVLARLEREGVERIVITNRNHTRAANRVHERTGASVWIHACDADHAREQGVGIDETLEFGERVGPFRVLDARGKSPGEIALHDPERRLLVVGDAVIGSPAGRLSLLPEALLDDPKQLRASLRRLLELDFDALLPGDGEPILAGARERLAELVARFDEPA
jgi:glyoxylase-like metal-dependent hydrolase (beta-lactamase superfamily II)